MSESYSWDVYDVCKEQLDLQIPKIEECILNLNNINKVQDCVDDLFRIFHSFKPSAQYLALTPFHKLAAKVESVLGSLRDKKNETLIVQGSVIVWLLEITDVLTSWSLQMDLRETNLRPVPLGLLNKVHITDEYIKPIEKLKSLHLLYCDNNEKRAKKIISFLKTLSSKVSFSSNLKDAKQQLELDSIDILVTNLNTEAKENDALITFAKEHLTNLAIVAIFDQITSLCSKKLLKKGVSHTIVNPLNSKRLKRELVAIIKVYHSSSNIIIDHKKIHNFIQTLQPLPNTIFQILQICDDDEIPVKELIKTVKTDPILAAHILNVANSPLYGNVTLKTIDQAVTKFGKNVIKALAMSGLHESLGSIDLSAYEMHENTFSQVSMLRLSLMLKWYAKVSLADLSVLSSSALLGNIGQLLISKEIQDTENISKFQELCHTVSIDFAEESILYTNTNIVSSQILNYWKLSTDVVDVISYSDNPDDAPLELKQLCVANHIVYRLVDLQANIQDTIPDELLVMMALNDLDPKPLEKALQSLKS